MTRKNPSALNEPTVWPLEAIGDQRITLNFGERLKESYTRVREIQRSREGNPLSSRILKISRPLSQMAAYVVIPLYSC